MIRSTVTPTPLVHRIEPPDSPQARFAAATLLAIPPDVRQALRDAVATSLGIPIDCYGPDVDLVDPTLQAAYDADVDDLFDCWVRKHVFESDDDALFRRALRIPPVRSEPLTPQPQL
ncbi:MAG TPA: hypothetical protein VMF14_15620 [Solirubrobacteraceae bacterium]|nr:hypothetical protein [Solirubrobacteraceae bacterium]